MACLILVISKRNKHHRVLKDKSSLATLRYFSKVFRMCVCVHLLENNLFHIHKRTDMTYTLSLYLHSSSYGSSINRNIYIVYFYLTRKCFHKNIQYNIPVYLRHCKFNLYTGTTFLEKYRKKKNNYYTYVTAYT